MSMKTETERRLEAAEAEVARLTADRDSRHNAWAAAVKQANAAEARAAKAEALVEAGLREVTEWQGVLDECKANDPRWILDQSVMTLDTALTELRAALGGAK